MNRRVFCNIGLLCLLLFSCRKGSDSPEYSVFEIVPEAPLDLYCKLNEDLTDDEKLSFCQYNTKGSQVWIQLSFRNGFEGIDSLVVTLFEVVQSNYDKIQKSPVIDSVFNEKRLRKIQVLVPSSKYAYIFRMRPDMFCQGYGEVFEIGSGAAGKAIEEQIERDEVDRN